MEQIFFSVTDLVTFFSEEVLLLWSQSIKGVKVAKKGAFVQLGGGGCISGTKRGRKSKFVSFNRSCRLVYA